MISGRRNKTNIDVCFFPPTSSKINDLQKQKRKKCPPSEWVHLGCRSDAELIMHRLEPLVKKPLQITVFTS